MTIPLSGQLGFNAINLELGVSDIEQRDLNSSSSRQLASVATGQIAVSDFYGKPVSGALPTYIGLSTQALITVAALKLLTNITPLTLPYDFNLTAGVNQYQYFASPVSLGQIQFKDLVSLFIGGWDGAHNDGFVTFGPRLLLIDGTSYNVYRTDFDNLGLCRWQAQVQV